MREGEGGRAGREMANRPEGRWLSRGGKVAELGG